MNVIYSPDGKVIGQANTQHGALRHAARIPRLTGERYTASIREVIDHNDLPDFTPVWLIGIQRVTP
jgi:hypothetical protein